MEIRDTDPEHYSVARSEIRNLPTLLPSVRYVDPYIDGWRQIQRPLANDHWVLRYDTVSKDLDFSVVSDADVKLLWKHFVASLLRERSPFSVHDTYYALLRIRSLHSENWFLDALVQPTHSWIDEWDVNWRTDLSNAVYVKSFLNFLCDFSLGPFEAEYKDFVRSLPFKYQKGYRGVVTGSSVLPVSEEQQIIQFLDNAVQNCLELSDEELLKVCLLSLAYQHGLRAIQITRMNLRDFTLLNDAEGNQLAYFTAYQAKKRNLTDQREFKRKIKREWVPIFAEYLKRRTKAKVWKQSNKAEESKLFPVDRSLIIASIADTTMFVTGKRRSATSLRHTAAQRIVDAGASSEEVAEFLGHSHTKTSLSYFEASLTQAAKLNQALAISPIYSALADIGKTKSIDKEQLIEMEPDYQIGGVPHGIPISGIGACGIGQSLCAKHPALSCYTCPKFLPISDSSVHTSVLEDLRKVVRFFFDQSQGDNSQSSAFVQLRATLEAIKRTVNGLLKEGGGD
ncbi:hypothetical protein TH4_12970 [Thalassospira tepidiphila MCCC 1A03514]|uniref:Tyr recombinase domain-containing protein n=1 Tax=Thalassospira tepidiphila MCCC 1A03514 TaxID=1177930 RepID=A0A853KXR0_9PROT|nr:hypothetical protein TH4_12970 [Thalassospira tepidiphila MCCC 1A03514]